jgi:hypothetical protein
LGVEKLHRAEREEIKTFASGSGEKSEVLPFSPDGKRVASGSADKTARIGDVATGKEVQRLTGPGDRVTVVVFSADGRRLLSGSPGQTVRLWAFEEETDDEREPCHLGDQRHAPDEAAGQGELVGVPDQQFGALQFLLYHGRAHRRRSSVSPQRQRRPKQHRHAPMHGKPPSLRPDDRPASAAFASACCSSSVPVTDDHREHPKTTKLPSDRASTWS